jgi:hypothetical protein
MTQVLGIDVIPASWLVPLRLSAGTRRCMVAAEDAGRYPVWNRGDAPLPDVSGDPRASLRGIRGAPGCSGGVRADPAGWLGVVVAPGRGGDKR